MSTPTRRTFIQAGLVGATALAIGGLGLGLRATVYRAPAMPLQALSPRGFSVVAALADRFFDYGGDGLPTAAEVQVAELVDAYLATAHPAVTVEIEQALFLLENAAAGALLEGRFTTFTGSSPAVQDAILQGWAGASIPIFRKAYRGLHALLNGVYWGDARTYAAIGYPGPPPLGAAAVQPVPTSIAPEPR